MSDGSGNPTPGEVLEAIERERSAWENLLAEVGESRMLEPGAVGDWSFKDLVAHLAAWDVRDLDRLEAAAHGQPEPAPAWPADRQGDDEINAWIQEQNADLLLGEVVDNSRRVYARLAEVVQALPEADLNDPARFPWMDGEALGPAIVSGAWFGHLHDEHEPAIREWLTRPPAPREAPDVEL